MSKFYEALERDLVLHVGSYLDSQRDALKNYERRFGKRLQALVLLDEARPLSKKDVSKDPKAIVVRCDFSSDVAIQNALKPYQDRFLAATCRAEKNVPLLKRIVPHLPYLQLPTEKSLDWTTSKIDMRRLLRSYDKDISVKFLVVHAADEFTMDRIEKQVGFPLILKPSGLAASLLVTVCYHREELEDNLKNIVKKINQIYKKKSGRGEPEILVEQFMEGSMYSVDCYVNNRGVVYHTPLVHVTTGRAVGFDDFFGYQRITPVQLKPHKIEAANRAASKAIEAMGLRSTTCHIELMKTEDGWKVIELGPRQGGFRHEMYQLSYGLDHSLNDVMIRIPRKPIIPKKVKGYTAVMQFYPEKKGRLLSIEGVNKARKLESFKRIEIKKLKGEMCDFARNGDDPVFDIVLFNPIHSRLLADIRRLEKSIRIQVKSVKKTRN